MKKYQNAFLAIVAATFLGGCGISDNQCDTLAKTVCKDSRFKKLKERNQKNLKNFVISPGPDRFGFPGTSQIPDDCGRAEELTRISREGDTPYARDTALYVCSAYNAQIEIFFQFLPDK